MALFHFCGFYWTILFQIFLDFESIHGKSNVLFYFYHFYFYSLIHIMHTKKIKYTIIIQTIQNNTFQISHKIEIINKFEQIYNNTYLQRRVCLALVRRFRTVQKLDRTLRFDFQKYQLIKVLCKKMKPPLLFLIKSSGRKPCSEF